MSCFYQQIHKQGVGFQEELEQGAQNSRELGLKLKDQVQTSCCIEVKGIRGVRCSLGKHQVKKDKHGDRWAVCRDSRNPDF